MSSASSAVTYTSVYTDSEPERIFWGANLTVVLHESSYSDTMDSLCRWMACLLPVEEKPLPPVDSPTAESPGYVTESDPEEDPEEYEDDVDRGWSVDLSMGTGTLDAKERRLGISNVGYGMVIRRYAGSTELAELHEHDTQDLYALLEDAQDSRTRISQRVTMDSQRVDLLMGDRMTLQETVLIVEEEAYASREAWAHAIGLSQAVHYELQTHHEQVYAHESQLHAHQTQLQLQGTLIQTQHQVHETRSQMQQAEMAELRETDRRRQAQMVETLCVMRDMRREMGDMQAELLALREQRRRARQPAPDARVPDHQDASRDADSHI
ncbi:hypothetical protein Tco_1112352 [Tanacetum coccineum]|uniref:Uncharacterized protein n=1 Tax=Tanacetum coccineum TaxID=301880 RepID=A0ABQ5IPG4_9ASTR